MVDGQRGFKPVDPSLISCDLPCDLEFAREVTGDRVKQLDDLTTTFRCTAPGAYTRGQHFGPLTQEEHLTNLRACRICTVYTHTEGSTS